MSLKVRLKPTFPARIVASTGISITQSGGVYTFSWTVASLSEIGSLAVSDHDNLLIPVWNEDTLTFRTVAIDTLLTSLTAGLDATLVTIAALNPTTDQSIYFSATNVAAAYSLTGFARTLTAAASAAAAATVLGLGTGDSPQFTAINVGHATDTTISRVSAGVIAVEGSNVILASNLGTNVAAFLATPSSANLAAALTDETGTGANVFATSPTLVTPVLGTPASGTLTNCTGLPIAGVTGLATSTTDNAAVRYDGTGGNQQNSALIIADTTGALSRSGGGGVPIQATNTDDSAASDQLGYEVLSEVLTGAAVSSPGSGTPFDITSISVPAGNWRIEGTVWTKPDATTTTSFLIGWTHTGSATNPTSPNKGSKVQFIAGIAAGLETGLPTGAQNVKLSATTTFYLGASLGFAISTMQAYGYIKATRIR